MTLQDVIYGAISGTSNFHASNKQNRKKKKKKKKGEEEEEIKKERKKGSQAQLCLNNILAIHAYLLYLSKNLISFKILFPLCLGYHSLKQYDFSSLGQLLISIAKDDSSYLFICLLDCLFITSMCAPVS